MKPEITRTTNMLTIQTAATSFALKDEIGKCFMASSLHNYRAFIIGVSARIHNPYSDSPKKLTP